MGYRKDPDRTLMTFAAYNAGPGNFWRIRDAAIARGLDPHVWFNNVESEAARLIGRETVQNVANIFKYYISFKLAKERLEAKKEANLRLSKRTGIKSWTNGRLR